jgi:hypothetical protein
MIIEKCLLCARTFCEAHKAEKGIDDVCNVNHVTRYDRHLYIHVIYLSMQTGERALLPGGPLLH